MTRSAVNLQFGVDEQGITYLERSPGNQADLAMPALYGAFIYEIISDFVLGIVNTLDEANTLPEAI